LRLSKKNILRISKRYGDGWGYIRDRQEIFFDALVGLKFLERRDGRYYNTASTAFFEVQNPRPSSSKLNWLFRFSQGFANSLDTLAQLKHF